MIHYTTYNNTICETTPPSSERKQRVVSTSAERVRRRPRVARDGTARAAFVFPVSSEQLSTHTYTIHLHTTRDHAYSLLFFAPA
jgi:hypothetical protein